MHTPLSERVTLHSSDQQNCNSPNQPSYDLVFILFFFLGLVCALHSSDVFIRIRNIYETIQKKNERKVI